MAHKRDRPLVSQETGEQLIINSFLPYINIRVLFASELRVDLFMSMEMDFSI